jgi:hypothetical protein
MTDQTQQFGKNLATVLKYTFSCVSVLMEGQRDLPPEAPQKWHPHKEFPVQAAIWVAEELGADIPKEPVKADFERLFGRDYFDGAKTIMAGLLLLKDEFNYSERKVLGKRRLPTREEIWYLREQIRQLAQAGSGQDLSHLACQA